MTRKAQSIKASSEPRPLVVATKPGFLTPLRTEDIDGCRAKLLDRLGFCSAVLEREVWLEPGFEADSYSAPYDLVGSWIVRGLDRRPSWIHDKLYGEHSCTRLEADQVLLEAMEVVGVSWWRRQVIYRAVRMFGGAFWGGEPPTPQSNDSMPGG